MTKLHSNPRYDHVNPNDLLVNLKYKTYYNNLHLDLDSSVNL